MKSSIKKNLGFQTVFQILNTCLPLITAPYLARVLGATQLGVFSYTSSIVAYFTLFAMLGTINYGTRSIATVKNDRAKRTRIFWGIYILQISCTLIACIAYIMYLIIGCQENKLIASIQIVALVSCFLDITWLFFGIEDFKTTVTCSMVFRIITVIAILFMVKSEQDLWIYTILMLGGTFLSQGVLWLFVPKIIDREHICLSEVIQHIKPNFILFIPLLAMSVYHTMDKTMLGILSTYEQSGFYYNTDKVINIPLCIINGVGTVMLPRMTALIQERKKKEANHLFVISLEGVCVVSVAMAFGIASISNEFIPIFFGKGYDSCIILTIVLAPVLVIKGVSNTVRTQYLVPMKMEKIFTQSVLVGAVINLIFNLILIPKIGAMGAVIGTLLAELVSCIWQLICMKKYIKLNRNIFNCCVYLIFGIIMFICVRGCALFHKNLLIQIAFEIIVGGLIYIILCIIYWLKTNNEMYKVIFGNYLSKIPFLRNFF